MTSYQFQAIWPVWDAGMGVAALSDLALPDLVAMVDDQEAVLTADPQWTLYGGRLSATAPARRRAPWDETDPDDLVKAYLIDMLPDPTDFGATP